MFVCFLPALQVVSEGRESSHSNLVVELSNQLSEQGSRIAELETQLVEKDELLEKLRSEHDKACQELSRDPRRDVDVTSLQSDACSVDRLPTGRGSRLKKTRRVAAERDSVQSAGDQVARREGDSRQGTSRMSTALSDSDSDWSLDHGEGQGHTRSAPARVRVRSGRSKKHVARSAGVEMEDDTILKYIGEPLATQVKPSPELTPFKRKSPSKSYFGKHKTDDETKSLIGPSVAFAAMTTEFTSDTSNEASPRYSDPAHLPGFSKLTIVNAVKN